MGISKLPGEQHRTVGCRQGPSAYVQGGFGIHVDVGDITKDEDVLGAYCRTPLYNVVISGWSSPADVNVVVQYGAGTPPGVFQEVSAGTNLWAYEFCAEAKGR